MVEEIGPLPARWANKVDTKQQDVADEGVTLEEWLMELYFDVDEEACFSRKQLQSWASLILMLMRYEPTERVPAAKALEHDCLR